MRYSKLELFGKGYHTKSLCFVGLLFPEGYQHSGRKLVGHLEFTLALSKHLFSLLKLKTIAWGLGHSELENTRRIDIFVHVSCLSVLIQMLCNVEKIDILTALFSKQRMLPR